MTLTFLADKLEARTTSKIHKLTSFEGTHSGTPRLSCPASTDTPIIMGLRALNMCCGRILNLHGKIAKCSFCRRRLSLNSSLKFRNDK